MEKMASRIAENISVQMNYDKDKQSVIAYGLIAIFQMLTIAIAISIIGILADFWFEAMVIFLGVGLLRKSTGGAHAQTLLGCTIFSITIICTMSLFCRYVIMHSFPLYILMPIYFGLIGVCFLVAYKKVPIDSPNKPITRVDKIKRLRKQSFITIFIYFVICVIFSLISIYNIRFLSLSASIVFGLLWQTFTLTKLGSALIYAFDSLFESTKQ